MDEKKDSGAPGILILALIALFLFSQKSDILPPDPPTPDAPLATWVRYQASLVGGSTAAAEAETLAASYRALADEIESLADPLSSSTLKRPGDAIAKISTVSQQMLGPRTSAWRPFFDALATRLEQLEAAGKIERSIYAVGAVYAEVAQGLAPIRGPPCEDCGETVQVPAEAVRLCAAEGTADYDPEQAYTQGGQIGVYLDEPGQPAWARELARQGDAQFRAAGGQRASRSFSNLFAGEGKGKRAVYWNYAMRFDGDPLPVFGIKQITGNCVEASNGDVTVTHLLGVAIFLLKKPYEWEGPGSTLFYSRRGHCGQGMNLGTAASAHKEDGIAWRKQYCGGKYDFRDTLADQKFAMSNCRSPKSNLTDLWAETQKTPVGQVASFDGSWEQAIDILYVGGALHTGSTATASRNGDPVSSGAGVGAHAQTCIGYDDTEEFRTWYKQQTGKTLTEPVFMFDQTWGDQPYVQKNWPSHLWGKATPGMFVLPWSAARKLIGSTCYAYWPDLTGVTPAKLRWRLDNARKIARSLGNAGSRDVDLAIAP